MAMLTPKGNARITVLAVLEHMDRVVGRFSGELSRSQLRQEAAIDNRLTVMSGEFDAALA